METWFVRGYLVFAVAVLLLGGFVWVRVDLLPDDGRGGGAAIATSSGPGGVLSEATPETLGTPGVVVTPTPPVYTGRCETTPVLAAPPVWQPSQPAFFTEWYGYPGGDLAVAPALMSALAPQLPVSDARWFAGVELPMSWFGTDGPLVLSAVQIDGGGRIAAEVQSGQFQDEKQQLVEMTFPEPGCWQVTAQGQGADSDLTATLIVEVAPKEERPDVASALAAQQAQPFAVPTNCAVDGWDALDVRSPTVLAAWWKDLPLMAVGHATGVLWAQAQTTFLLRPEAEMQGLRVEATSLEDGSFWRADARASGQRLMFAMGTFATPGCWEVRVQSGLDEMAAFTVYVFPNACRRESDATPVPDDCTAPAGNP